MHTETDNRVHTVDLEPSERYATPGAIRKTVFETESNIMLETRIPGGTTSGWHHHGTREVFVYTIAGGMTVEGGLERRTAESKPGQYTYFRSEASPDAVHRYVVPDDVDEHVSIVNLVGSGPAVVNVENPESLL